MTRILALDRLSATEVFTGLEPVANVRAYGAVGDGSTNDTKPIQDAIDAVNEVGAGVVWLPVGVYLLGSALELKSGVWIVGASRMAGSGSVLRLGANVAAISCGTSGVAETGLVNFAIDGNGYTGAGVHVHMDRSVVERLRIYGITGNALDLNDPALIVGDPAGGLNHIRDCYIDEATVHGIYAHYRFTDSWIEGCNIGAGDTDILIEGGPIRILHNHLNGTGSYRPNYCIDAAAGAYSVVIVNNLLEGANKSCIHYQRPSWEATSTPSKWAIVGNLIRDASQESSGSYPLIDLQGFHDGVAADVLVNGVAITGNSFENRDATVPNYGVYCKYSQNVTITGNDFTGSYGTGTVYTDGTDNNITQSANAG